MIPEFKFKGQPLSEKNSELFMRAFLTKEKEVPFQKNEDLSKEFLCRIIEKRMEAYKLSFILTDLFIIMSIITWVDSPAKTVCLLYMAFKYHKKTGKDILDIEAWANMFPWGTPTEEEFQKWWLSQKYEDKENPMKDNLIDDFNLWQA